MRKKNPRKKSFLFLMTELSSGPLLHQPETQLYCTHHWIPAPSLQGMKSHIAKPPVPFPKAWLLPDLFHGSLQHFPWFRLILCSAQSTKLTALRDLPLRSLLFFILLLTLGHFYCSFSISFKCEVGLFI